MPKPSTSKKSAQARAGARARKARLKNGIKLKQPPEGELRFSHNSEQAIDSIMGGLIRRYRHMRCATQQDVAEGVGVKFQQVQKYETGANRVSISRFLRICDYLQIEPAQAISELVDMASASKSEEVHPMDDMTVEDFRMVAAVRSLSVTDQSALRTVIRTMTGEE